MIDVALTTLLKASAGVGDRVYCGGEVVEVTRDPPKVVYTWIGGDTIYSDDGNVGLIKGRYQLDIFAARPTACRSIADAIRNALDGYSGSQDGTPIVRIYFPDRGQVIGPEVPVGQKASAARFSQDLLIDYRENVS